ncbi:MAG TPA: hypothetical protein DCR93_02290, partial [Cytophagales bacterium]|nr:hypothetical protein [Cytophagales bacterium]
MTEVRVNQYPSRLTGYVKWQSDRLEVQAQLHRTVQAFDRPFNRALVPGSLSTTYRRRKQHDFVDAKYYWHPADSTPHVGFVRVGYDRFREIDTQPLFDPRGANVVFGYDVGQPPLRELNTHTHQAYAQVHYSY